MPKNGNVTFNRTINIFGHMASSHFVDGFFFSADKMLLLIDPAFLWPLSFYISYCDVIGTDMTVV